MAVFLFCVLGGFVGGSIIWIRDMSMPPEERTDCRIFIEPGANTSQISQILKSNKIIRSAFLFRLYIRFLAVDQRLRPGCYFFSAGESLDQVVFKLLQGMMKTVQVTIPEGTTNRQVADLLEYAGICTSKEFLEACNDPQLIGRVFSDWELIPAGEGLLFPDTYIFNRPTLAFKVAERMFRLTKFQIDAIFGKKLSTGLSQYEGCILASIIEKEAAKETEKPIIASVFYNRLKKGIKLESCATVLYAHGQHKERLLYEDLKIDSPFNTYLNQGLPPTPISNFGASSMRAVAHPAKTDYLYFVSDGKGGHQFSKTLKEHNHNARKFFKNRKARKGGNK